MKNSIKKKSSRVFVVAVIPARGGSQRLPHKNIYPFKGKAMIAHSIEAAKHCRLIDEVYVSTDSFEIAEVATKFGAEVIKRDEKLATNESPLIFTLQNAYNNVTMRGVKPSIMVCLYPNCPSRAPATITKCIRLLKEENRNEVRTYNSKGVETGNVWVLKAEQLFQNYLSTYTGAVVDDGIEIHTLSDLRKAEKQWPQRKRKKSTTIT